MIDNADLSEFTEIFLSILGKHALKKQDKKSLYEQITLISQLQESHYEKVKTLKQIFNERTNGTKSLCSKQRNLCVGILRKNKRDYFGNLNNNIITDNRKFWKTISPLFSE